MTFRESHCERAPVRLAQHLALMVHRRGLATGPEALLLVTLDIARGEDGRGSPRLGLGVIGTPGIGDPGGPDALL